MNTEQRSASPIEVKLAFVADWEVWEGPRRVKLLANGHWLRCEVDPTKQDIWPYYEFFISDGALGPVNSFDIVPPVHGYIEVSC